MPVDESGTTSTWAFSRSFGSVVLMPGNRRPLGNLQVQPGDLPASRRAVRPASLWPPAFPSGLMAGTPQASTVSVNKANGIQARATPRRVRAQLDSSPRIAQCDGA